MKITRVRTRCIACRCSLLLCNATIRRTILTEPFHRSLDAFLSPMPYSRDPASVHIMPPTAASVSGSRSDMYLRNNATKE